MTQVLPSQPQAAIAATRGRRWLQVMSHVHPRYGGLSSAVPAMGVRMRQTQGFEPGLAAFCRLEECITPAGYSRDDLTFWPTSRRVWLTNGSWRREFHQEIGRWDGVHIHGLWEQSTVGASRAAARLHKPYIVSAHGMLEPWAQQAKRLKKAVYARLIERSTIAHASALHALTRSEAEHYIGFGARSPIAVIPNAVEVPARTDPRPFLTRFPDLERKRVVLFLARLHPKKGVDLLLSAWQSVHREWPEARLVVAGPDFQGTRATLEAQARAQGSTGSVVFTGMLDAAMKWSALAAAQGFILPSHSEGLSMSVLEAMGVGLPVIVTRPCNMPEVRRYEAGWEVEPEVDSIAAALRQLLSNSDSANLQIGSRGADLISTRYSYATVTRQMAAFYDFVQGGPTPLEVELILP